MKAIENLRNYIEEVDQTHYVHTRASISALGTDLVRAALEPEGYKDLVWRAGFYLLYNSLEHLKNGADEFFHEYGYRAIANALRTSIEAGDFPLALGFLIHDFLPDGGLEELANNTTIKQALKNIPEKKLTYHLEILQSVDGKSRETYREFLGYARAFGFPLSSCLQMVAALFTVADEQEQPQIARTLLELLEENGKNISLFYCWRAIVETFSTTVSETTYASSIVSMLKVCKELGDEAPAVVARLLDDQELVSLIGEDNCLHILLGLAGWWIYIRYRLVQYRGLARNFCWMLDNDAPILGRAMQDQIESIDSGASKDLASNELEDLRIEKLQMEFQKEMQMLQNELRLRTYHGVPLAMEIYRSNVISIYEPLYAALEGSSTLTHEQIRQIKLLNAEELIDENVHQRNSSRSMHIMGALRANMIKDQQKIINILHRTLALRQQLNASTDYDPSTTLCTPAIKREVKLVLQNYPDVSWALEWFLPEVLEIH